MTGENKKNESQHFSPSKNFFILFNGEIYNYKELKILVKRRGYKFSTSSDTEVLIKSIHCWGFNSFKKFEGLHLLRQDPWECLVTFICSSNNNMKLDAIAFNTTDKNWPSKSEQILTTYRLGINEYQGNSKLQLFIEHIEPV